MAEKAEKSHESYKLVANEVQANIRIYSSPADYVPIYEIIIPITRDATRVETA